MLIGKWGVRMGTGRANSERRVETMRGTLKEAMREKETVRDKTNEGVREKQ